MLFLEQDHLFGLLPVEALWALPGASLACIYLILLSKHRSECMFDDHTVTQGENLQIFISN